jgi:uncharacterized protein YbjT (DUF2867 family)
MFAIPRSSAAFGGSDAVFTMLPPDATALDYRQLQDRTGEAIATAIADAGVGHVVFLSSLGADRPSGTGPIAGLHAQEQRLRQLRGAALLILRPAYFFENFYASLGLIKQKGINGGAIAGDVLFPMIATRDIADVAASALGRCDWSGVVVRELLGARDMTFAEATRIIGRHVGRPDLAYVQFPYEEFASSLEHAGLSPDVARLYAELARAINEGKVSSVEGRRPDTSTPTTFEEFAGELARAYGAGAS